MQTVVKESETFAFTGKSGTGNIFYGNLFGVMFMNVDIISLRRLFRVKPVFGLHQRQCKFKNLKTRYLRGQNAVLVRSRGCFLKSKRNRG